MDCHKHAFKKCCFCQDQEPVVKLAYRPDPVAIKIDDNWTHHWICDACFEKSYDEAKRLKFIGVQR